MNITKKQDVFQLDVETDALCSVYDEQGNELAVGVPPLTWVDASIHPVYKVKMNDTITYLAQRDLPETNITNFRDLGGYPTLDGGQVRYRTFYRCAPVVAVDDTAKSILESLSIKTIMDFRSEAEAEKLPDTTLKDCELFHIGAISSTDHAFGGNFDFKELLAKVDVETLKQYMQKTYEELPFQNEAYNVMFQRMLAHKVPLAFHCSAGKDRTGVAAYLILKTLGVADDIIMQDYLLSNVYRKEENEQIRKYAGEKGDVVMSLMMVYEDYLQTAIDAIQKRYPSFEAYLLEEYNITKAQIEQLRAMYVYPKEEQ